VLEHISIGKSAPGLSQELMLGEIEEALAVESKGERMRDGLVVAITGPPNVGKSRIPRNLVRY
jgi:tRNA modification GTPase